MVCLDRSERLDPHGPLRRRRARSAPFERCAHVRELNDGPASEDHRAEDRRPQLANVARPLLPVELVERPGGERPWRRVACGDDLGAEPLDQRRQLLASIAERRHQDDHALQPVVEVFAERPCRDHLQHVAVGRRDHAHVHLDRPDAADAVDLSFLERTQQRHLHLHRDLPHLVEEQRAAARLLEAPDLAPLGARERAALVTEELARQQTLRERGAVDLDQRPGRTPTPLVHEVRQDLLADAGLPLQQHRQVGRRDATQGPVDRPHRRADRRDSGAQQARVRLRLDGVAHRVRVKLGLHRLEQERGRRRVRRERGDGAVEARAAEPDAFAPAGLAPRRGDLLARDLRSTSIRARLHDVEAAGVALADHRTGIEAGAQQLHELTQAASAAVALRHSEAEQRDRLSRVLRQRDLVDDATPEVAEPERARQRVLDREALQLCALARGRRLRHDRRQQLEVEVRRRRGVEAEQHHAARLARIAERQTDRRAGLRQHLAPRLRHPAAARDHAERTADREVVEAEQVGGCCARLGASVLEQRRVDRVGVRVVRAEPAQLLDRALGVLLRGERADGPAERLHVLEAALQVSGHLVEGARQPPDLAALVIGDPRRELAAGQRVRALLEPLDRATDPAAHHERQERREHDQRTRDEQEERAHRDLADREVERRVLVGHRRDQERARRLLEIAQHLGADDHVASRPRLPQDHRLPRLFGGRQRALPGGHRRRVVGCLHQALRAPAARARGERIAPHVGQQQILPRRERAQQAAVKRPAHGQRQRAVAQGQLVPHAEHQLPPLHEETWLEARRRLGARQPLVAGREHDRRDTFARPLPFEPQESAAPLRRQLAREQRLELLRRVLDRSRFRRVAERRVRERAQVLQPLLCGLLHALLLVFELHHGAADGVADVAFQVRLVAALEHLHEDERQQPERRQRRDREHRHQAEAEVRDRSQQLAEHHQQKRRAHEAQQQPELIGGLLRRRPLTVGRRDREHRAVPAVTAERREQRQAAPAIGQQRCRLRRLGRPDRARQGLDFDAGVDAERRCAQLTRAVDGHDEVLEPGQRLVAQHPLAALLDQRGVRRVARRDRSLVDEHHGAEAHPVVREVPELDRRHRSIAGQVQQRIADVDVPLLRVVDPAEGDGRRRGPRRVVARVVHRELVEHRDLVLEHQGLLLAPVAEVQDHLRDARARVRRRQPRIGCAVEQPELLGRLHGVGDRHLADRAGRELQARVLRVGTAQIRQHAVARRLAQRQRLDGARLAALERHPDEADVRVAGAAERGRAERRFQLELHDACLPEVAAE